MSSSGATTWLHTKRKTDLVEIAEKVGLKEYDDLKKADLETALDEHLRANQTKLAKDASLAAFFKRLNAELAGETKESSPTEAKTPRRRTIKPREDVEGDTSEGASGNSFALTKTPAKTPARSLAFASSVPLPPSPAEVASHIDRQTARVRSSLRKAVKQSGVAERVDTVRDTISTTPFIESIAIGLELVFLQKEFLPYRNFAVFPAIPALGMTEIPLKAPDLFVLLKSEFWALFTLWLHTSVLIPLTFAYFFNLTLKAKHGGVKHAKNLHPLAQYDPLIFNLAKAVTTWLAYSKHFSLLGFPSANNAAKIDYLLPGGWYGVLVGAGIGTITSIYEAILRK